MIFKKRKCFFHITNNGITPFKYFTKRYKYSLPFRDWIKHNNIENLKYEIITFIRSPYERTLLQYQNQLLKRPAIRQYPITFKEWVFLNFKTKEAFKFMRNKPKDFLSQTSWLEGSEDKIKTYKVENLTNMEIYKLGFMKSDVEIDKFYDKETKEIIYEYFLEDFKNYVYIK